MAKIRVLIADDSVVIRQMLADVIGRDPDIEVAAIAANGRIALQRISSSRPDMVLLDMQMPEMDGLETVKAIRRTDRRLPIIIVSSITERGATITLDALSAGATDYWTKPKNAKSVEDARARIRQELIPKIKALSRPAMGPTPPSPPRGLSSPKPRSQASRCAARVDVVAIGCSTGGPDALAAVLSQLPEKFPVPIVIAQHMPPIFTSLLAERLAARSLLRVREGAAGEPLRPGCIWIAPGDRHMIVVRENPEVRLALHQEAPENFCRPSIDVLFRSVAQVYGSGSLAVVLTGMGNDGAQGCEKIRDAGGHVLAQDEASSVVWGIPGSVVRAGLADSVVCLAELPLEISRRVASLRNSHPAAEATAPTRTAHER